MERRSGFPARFPEWSAVLSEPDSLPDFLALLVARRSPESWTPHRLYGGLVAVAHRDDVLVERALTLPDQALGRYWAHETPKRIVIREDAPVVMTRTLAHELSHYVAGHIGTTDEERLRETEATADWSAALILAHFGLEAGEVDCSSLAYWRRTGQSQVGRRALGHSRRISGTIIAGVGA